MSGTTLSGQVATIFDHVAKRCDATEKDNAIRTYISRCGAFVLFSRSVFFFFLHAPGTFHCSAFSNARHLNFSLDRNSFLETNEEGRSRTFGERKDRWEEDSVKNDACIGRSSIKKKYIYMYKIVLRRSLRWSVISDCKIQRGEKGIISVFHCLSGKSDASVKCGTGFAGSRGKRPR